MHSHQPHPSTTSYRVFVTDRTTRELVNREGCHYESPPQSEQQARSLIAVLTGAEIGDHCGPWREAIAGGQRIIELRAER